MKKIFVLSTLFSAFLCFSCESEGAKPCSEEKPASSLIVDFPDSVQVGTIETVEIQYILESSCGSFDRFEIQLADNSFDIKLMTSYQGCSCNLQLIEKSAQFEINVDYPGIYEFRFWLADGDLDVRTVKVFE